VVAEVMFLWSPLQFIAVNLTDEPIEHVSITVERNRAEPEYAQDPSLIQADQMNRLTVSPQGTLTLRPQMATPILPVPAYLVPNTDRPTLYQIRIYAKRQALTEILYVTPKDGGFDEAVDLADDKTKNWLKRDATEAMKRWKHWPEWWK